ncbi:hypothetical protein PMAYCL1PPCAC_01195, partial [Pristionchus mayeri]
GDPGIDLTTKPIMEQMRQMALNRLSAHIGDIQDDVPFLKLPNEVISGILSLLPPKDRLNARVNKRLNAVEAESKYFVKELNIVEVEFDRLEFIDVSRPQDIYFTEDEACSALDFVKRIVHNASIGSLTVSLEAWGSLYREFYNIVKEFKNIGHLTVNFEKELFMSDSHFLLLVDSFEELCLNRARGVTVDVLHKVYKNMVEGYATIRKFELSKTRGLGGDDAGSPLLLSFLTEIGIQFQRVFVANANFLVSLGFLSNRDIEAFKKIVNGIDRYHIFDGNVEIAFTAPYHGQDLLILKLHESEESLEEAKNEQGMTRVRVDPLPL